MADAAETNNVRHTAEQPFGYSLQTVSKYGGALCRAAGVEMEGKIEEELWQDFVTCVQENVVISDQLVKDERASRVREKLKFEPMRVLEVFNGQVITKDGRPMVDVCWDGWEAAKAKEATDPRMDSEVERSSYDVWVAQQVDKLEPGELFAVPSMEPLEAMDRDGDKFWKDVSIIGYTRGLAVWQVYYKVNGTQVLAGAYSVKGSSKAIFQRQLMQHNVHVPLDTPANQWILNPIRKKATPEEAKRFGPQLHDEYRQLAGRRAEGISVTKLMEDNKPLVRAYFEVYMKALSLAYYTGKNNHTMQGFAAELLDSARLFSVNDRRTIARIATDEPFTEQDALFMEKTIRYACAEELWALLLNDEAKGETGFVGRAGGVQEYAAVLHVRAASRVQTGILVGRSGGGCNALRFEKPEGDDDDDDLGQQDVFGGNAKKETADDQPLACAYTHDQCYCSPYDDFGNPRGAKKLVVAYRNRKGVAVCLRDGCGAKIDNKSNVLSKGGIYELAQAKQEQAHLEEMAKQVLRPRAIDGLALRIQAAKHDNRNEKGEEPELAVTGAGSAKT